MTNRKLGVMLKTIKLTGTDLQLVEGQTIELIPAINIPNGEGRYFGTLPGWGKDSILLEPGDFKWK